MALRNPDFFISDPEFCSDCGAVLPLPGMSDVVVCRVCGHEVDASVFDGLETETVIYFDAEWKKEAQARSKSKKAKSKSKKAVADGPLVDRKCAKCGHEQMSYATLQTRSADEGQTVFYTCPRCNAKEIENS